MKKLIQGKDVPEIMDQLTGVIISSDAGAGVGYTGMHCAR